MRTVVVRFEDDELDRLADRVAAKLVAQLDQSHSRPVEWMTTAEAAKYLGQSVNAVHKLTSTREIPFSQDGKGARCWFRRADLDRWRENHAHGPR